MDMRYLRFRFLSGLSSLLLLLASCVASSTSPLFGWLLIAFVPLQVVLFQAPWWFEMAREDGERPPVPEAVRGTWAPVAGGLIAILLLEATGIPLIGILPLLLGFGIALRVPGEHRVARAALSVLNLLTGAWIYLASVVGHLNPYWWEW